MQNQDQDQDQDQDQPLALLMRRDRKQSEETYQEARAGLLFCANQLIRKLQLMVDQLEQDPDYRPGVGYFMPSLAFSIQEHAAKLVAYGVYRAAMQDIVETSIGPDDLGPYGHGPQDEEGM